MMKKAIIPIVFAAIFCSAAAGAQILRKTPDIPDGEIRKLRIRYENPKYNDAYFAKRPFYERILHLEAPRKTMTVARFAGDGEARHLVYTRTDWLNNKTVATTVLTFAKGGYLVLESVEREVKNPDGKRVRYEYYDLSDPVYNYPKDAFHELVLEVFFRSLPLEAGYRTAFKIWVGPTAILPMFVDVDKVETVSVPAGNIECYRMQIIPNLEQFIGKFAAKVIQPIMPRFTFWMATGGSHPLVKYRGPLGQINIGNAPIEIHELVSITPPL